MSLDVFKYQAGAKKSNTYAGYAAGFSAALFAIQSGWIPNKMSFGFAENSYIFFMLISIYLKLEASTIQRDLLINIGLEQLAKRSDD